MALHWKRWKKPIGNSPRSGTRTVSSKKVHPYSKKPGKNSEKSTRHTSGCRSTNPNNSRSETRTKDGEWR
jgi:hypothetical protein